MYLYASLNNITNNRHNQQLQPTNGFTSIAANLSKIKGNFWMFFKAKVCVCVYFLVNPTAAGCKFLLLNSRDYYQKVQSAECFGLGEWVVASVLYAQIASKKKVARAASWRQKQQQQQLIHRGWAPLLMRTALSTATLTNRDTLCVVCWVLSSLSGAVNFYNYIAQL